MLTGGVRQLRQIANPKRWFSALPPANPSPDVPARSSTTDGSKRIEDSSTEPQSFHGLSDRPHLKRSRRRFPSEEWPKSAAAEDYPNSQYMGESQYASLPNILEQPQYWEMRQGYLPLEHNRWSLESEVDRYHLDSNLAAEWQAIIQATCNQWLSRAGPHDWKRKSIEGVAAPVFAMGYSGEHGDQMMLRLGQAISASIRADFLSLDVGSISRIASFMGKMAVRTRAPSTTYEDSRPLSTYLRGKFHSNVIGIGGLAGMIANRTTAATLEYLEDCMKRNRNAAPWRVIFLTGSADLVKCHRYRQDIAELVAAREGTGERTIFIINEGNRLDPMECTVSSYLPPQPDIDASFDEATSNSALVIPVPPPPETQAAPQPFGWLIDPVLRGPRFLVVPPKEPSKCLHHVRQLTKDAEDATFAKNYSALLGTLQKMGDANPIYRQFVERLPAIGQVVRAALPLQARILAPAEVTTVCLGIPLDLLGHKHEAASVLTKAVVRYFSARKTQQAAIPNLEPSNVLRTRKISEEGLSKHEKRFVNSIVTPEMIKTRFEDVGSLESVKSTLYELISFRVQRPELFGKGILKDAVSGILMFGPPGTGKTMLAKAVAAQSGTSFLSVTAGSIFDMYVGEGEKNVKALFSLARKLSPCVMFVDEVDALLETRSSSVGRSSRLEIINEFMAEWDGLLSTNQGVTVMAATNRPFSLDDAVLRRLPRRILVDLPDVKGRLEIMRLLLREDHVDPSIDLGAIAEKARNYSGSDLKNVSMAAAMRALRRAQTAGSDSFVITQDDLVEALSTVPASISDKMATLSELRQWDQEFGEGRRNAAGIPPFGFKK